MRAAFEAEGYRVFEAETLARGVIEAGTRKPDLIVLDLGLPDGDGVALVRDVRGWSSVPIIVLSARVDEADKVTALDAGADDYLVKPFGVAELMARVRAALRRRARGADESPIVELSRRQDRPRQPARHARRRRRPSHAARVPPARDARRPSGQGADAPAPAA